MKLSIALTTLLVSLANARTLTRECTLVTVVHLLIDPENSDDRDIRFECFVDPADGQSNTSYQVQLSDSETDMMITMLNNGDLISNESTLRSGASLQTNRQGNTIIIPDKITPSSFGMRMQTKNRKGPEHEGIKPILAVRVTDSTGRVHPDSAAEISDNIFGTGNDSINLSSQMHACSAGKLTITTEYDPAINTVATGVIEVTIPVSFDNDRVTIHNAVTAKVNSQFGITLPGQFEQVMYIVENCYVDCGYAAYAYINSWMSVYIKWYYAQAGVQMHEIGHNFGFAHSGGLNGSTYTDHTCMMGNPLYGDDLGQMCFNPAKNWQIGWYKDRVTTIETTQPVINSVMTLIGIADYENNNLAQRNVVVKLETNTATDYFVGFNRAAGMNSQNDEADDEVTIIQTGNNGESYSQSFLKATLQQGESFTVNGVVVKAEQININNNPGTAYVSFKKGSGPVPPTSPPVTAPVTAPVVQPVTGPVKRPTRAPRTTPAQQPTPAPRTTPVKQPTRGPRPTPPPAPTDGQCEVLCCYPIVNGVGGWATPRMLRECEEEGCHFIVNKYGNAYCTGKDYYKQCVSDKCGTNPTKSPVKNPTKSPVITPTTPTDCDDLDKYLLQVKIQNDNESKLKYVVQRKNKNKWAKRKDMKKLVKTVEPHMAAKCVPKKLCYRFKIIDKFNYDGLKRGGYSVIYDGVVIKDSQFENGAMEWIKFGEGCNDETNESVSI